ncbi:MAG: DMT family transporter [Ilumatobacteraceae bacterium]|nr:DMT family transporter [Ilumatobacteraceae bacterium]
MTLGLLGDLFLDRYLEIPSGVAEMSVETGLEAYQVTRVRNCPGALGTVMNNLAALGVGTLKPITAIGEESRSGRTSRHCSRIRSTASMRMTLLHLLHLHLLDVKILDMKSTAMRTLAAPVMWGTTYLTVTELLPDESPLVVAAMRVAPAGLVLLAVARSTGWWVPTGADWLRTSALALFNFGVFFPLLTIAVERLPGGVAAAFGGLQPLFVAGLAAPLLGTRPTRTQIGIALAAGFGVALVAIRPGAGLDPVGIAAAIAATGSFALGVVLTKRFGASRHRIAATGWQLLIAAALLVPLALAVDGAPSAPTPANIAGYLHLSMIATAGAFLVWFHGIANLSVAAPPLLGLAAPVTGATLGWIVLDQSLTPLQLVGFASTIAAIAYGATVSSRQQNRQAASLPVGTPPNAVRGDDPGAHARQVVEALTG